MKASTTFHEGPHTTYWCDICDAYWAERMDRDDEIALGDLKAEDDYLEFRAKFKTVGEQQK